MRRGSDSQPPVSRAFAQAGVVGFIALFVLVAYTFLHEGGHALVGLLFGGKIIAFSVSFWDLSAHVAIDGQFSDVQRGAISAAGVSLPVLVWAILLRLSPKDVDLVLAWLRTVASLAVINSLLPWIIIPFLYMNGQAPGDDVTSLLNRTQVQPLLVAGVSLAVYIGAWGLFFSCAGRPRALIAGLRRDAANPFTARALTTLRFVAVFGIALLALAGGATAYSAQPDPNGVPAGYTPATVVDLSQRGYANETVYRLDIEQPADVGFYFRMHDIKAGPAEITLIGPDGIVTVFLRTGTQFDAGNATVHPRTAMPLAKGRYEVRVTFPQTPGWVAIATKTEVR